MTVPRGDEGVHHYPNDTINHTNNNNNNNTSNNHLSSSHRAFSPSKVSFKSPPHSVHPPVQYHATMQPQTAVFNREVCELLDRGSLDDIGMLLESSAPRPDVSKYNSN